VAESTLVNPSTASARALVDALVAEGVREVVLCPGSRSSALAYAVAAAERAGRLRMHVRVDERSAGFLALGLAKVSRVPAVVITTSGTAVANLHPAVLEAHHARVPLLVLSADRPADLRGTGANQTTVQPGMFAGAVRWEGDLAPETALSELAAVAHAAVAAASGMASGNVSADVSADALTRHPAGPVHLNVQFREPLVPDLAHAAGRSEAAPPPGADGLGSREGTLGRSEGPQSGRKWPLDDSTARTDGAKAPVWRATDGSTAPVWRAEDSRAQDSSELVALPERTLVLLGDVPTTETSRAVLDWAEQQGLPVLGEPFGHHPRRGVVRHGVLVAGVEEFVQAHEPEVIVVVGRPTLSRPLARLVRRPGARLVLCSAGLELDVPGRDLLRVGLHALLRLTVTDPTIADPTVPDPNGPGNPSPGQSKVDEELLEAAADDSSSTFDCLGDAGGALGTWREQWLGAGRAVAAAVDADPPAERTGPALARALGAALPEETLLFVGSSNTPRDLDVAATFDQRVDVIASRGLAGIDGCVSTVIGIALASPERNTVAVLGDLTFLHDSGGLLIGPDEPRPNLTIVVANDDGGGIFGTLEPGEPARAQDFERLFGTPTGTELSALCRAHGIPHERAATAAALGAALRTDADGIRVIEVPIDRTTHRAERDRLRALAAAALA